MTRAFRPPVGGHREKVCARHLAAASGRRRICAAAPTNRTPLRIRSCIWMTRRSTSQTAASTALAWSSSSTTTPKPAAWPVGPDARTLRKRRRPLLSLPPTHQPRNNPPLSHRPRFPSSRSSPARNPACRPARDEVTSSSERRGCFAAPPRWPSCAPQARQFYLIGLGHTT